MRAARVLTEAVTLGWFVHLSEKRSFWSCGELPEDWCATPRGVICRGGEGKGVPLVVGWVGLRVCVPACVY